MAEYIILKEGYEGRKYIYHCKTGEIEFSVALFHPLKSANGFKNHLATGADRAIERANNPLIPERMYSQEDVTIILREKKYIAADEVFSEEMKDSTEATRG